MADKRTVLKRLRLAREAVLHETRMAGDDKFARGLACEGYAGGYMQALDDVDAMLTHGCPSDPRGYWRLDRGASLNET